MKKYTEEELQKILEDHKLWLSGEGGQRADLRYADLLGLKLADANLRYADLSNANLFGATLRYADLSGTDLSGASLYGSNLSGANFDRADLSNANLSHANLSGANFDRADLSGASLYGSDLSGATFSNTLILGEPVNKAPVQLSDLPYGVLITDTMMKIGCQTHSIDAWLAFTVEQIENMDRNAKKFYENYRKLIQAAVISHRIPKEENKES